MAASDDYLDNDKGLPTVLSNTSEYVLSLLPPLVTENDSRMGSSRDGSRRAGLLRLPKIGYSRPIPSPILRRAASAVLPSAPATARFNHPQVRPL